MTEKASLTIMRELTSKILVATAVITIVNKLNADECSTRATRACFGYVRDDNMGMSACQHIRCLPVIAGMNAEYTCRERGPMCVFARVWQTTMDRPRLNAVPA